MAMKSLSAFRRAPQCALAGGVCAGLAYWAGIPLWMVRVAVGAMLLVGLPLALVYLLAWVFMPAWSALPGDFERRVGMVESLD